MTIVDGRILIDDAEALNPGGDGIWTDETGNTMNPGLSTGVFIEGAAAVSERSSNGLGGVLFNTEVPNDWSGQTIYMWINMTAANALLTQANGGMTMRFAGSTITDWFEVNIGGSDTYGGGFQMFVVDVDLAAKNPDATNGTPPASTAIERIGAVFDTTGNTIPGNDDNLYVDAIWRLPAGAPGIRVEGQNSSVAWTWQDILDAADIADPTKAWGTIFRLNNGTIALNTPIRFGADDGTQDEFEDVNEVIGWEIQLVKDTFYGFDTIAGAGQMDVTWGQKVGSGLTATGIGGMTIVTGGPRWFFTAIDTDQDSVGLFGCTFVGSGPWNVEQTNVEIRSCVYSDCDTLTHDNGCTVAKCAFDGAPGPGPQVDLLSNPADGDFNDNAFTNMLWWAIEISENGPVTYNLRGVKFADNGTDRDILLSHISGLVTLAILSLGDTPGVTNGASVTINVNAACDIAVTAVGYGNVNQTTPIPESDGDNTVVGSDPLTAVVTPNDANSLALAVYGADNSGAVSWAGGSAYDEEIDDQDILIGEVIAAATKEGVTGAQTASADHSASVDLAVLSLIEVDNEAASVVLSDLFSGMRPVERSAASTSHVFSFGVPHGLSPSTDLAAIIAVMTKDAASLSDTDVTSISWGGTNMTEIREDLADDSTVLDVAAAIQEDPLAAFVDETTGANNATVGDVTLLSNPTAVDDAYYVGHASKFDDIEFIISTAAAGTYTIAWEYWDGAAWQALTVSDGTSDFQNSGTNNVTFVAPTDWATTTINSQGPYYYVRARVDTFVSGGNALGDEINLGGTTGASLRITLFRLIGSNLRKGTFAVQNAVNVEVSGMTEGAAVKVVARETAGTVSIGDTLGEGLTNSLGVFSFSIDYEGAFGAGLDVVVRAALNGLPNAAVADDGGVQTDETTAANSTTDDDMTLTPDNPQDVNDAYYLGHSEQFVNGPSGTIRLKLEITQAHGAGNPTVIWEFWNGLSWASLTFTDADPNPNFASTGEFIYEWNVEAGWSTSTENGQGPFYYIRARVTGAGTSTNGARGRFSTLDVTKFFRQDLNREITASGLETTVPWTINSLALFDPLND